MKTYLKTLTSEAARAAGIHSRAVDMLRESGLTLLRQFKANDRAKGSDESFELWARPGGGCVIVHFYADAAGVELYTQCPGNSWDAMRAALVNLGSFT